MVEPAEKNTMFADVLMPLPIPTTFTYEIPQNLQEKAKIGSRVVAFFGRKKIVTGVIKNIHHTPPDHHNIHPLLEILDDYAVITEIQWTFMHWISQYYLCAPGEVLQAMLPAGLKLSSESRMQIHPAFAHKSPQDSLSETEQMLLNFLQDQSLSYSEAERLLGPGAQTYLVVQSLQAKGEILLYEELKEKYKPKTDKYIQLTPAYANLQELLTLLKLLEKKPKQQDIILYFMQRMKEQTQPTEITKKKNSECGFSMSAVNTLCKKGILQEYQKIISRFNDLQDDSEGEDVVLSDIQQAAADDIRRQFQRYPAVLLHGITGSGKTTIYIRLIQEALLKGKQALYLLPEIALTKQIVKRLQAVFGKQIGVYHSRFSANERTEVYLNLLQKKYAFVVGVRSAVFLPFDNLGIIIVDEEHDGSFKQQDPAPRYHARDAALKLAQLHGANVLLGSATPSAESYYNAQEKKFGWVQLNQRFGTAVLPDIRLINLREERKKKTMRRQFSTPFIRAMEETVAAGKQVMVFQNRRGYAPYIQCPACGWIAQCVNCSVSLTYHQYAKQLQCHYCGYAENVPLQCPDCGGAHVKTVGYGTEKLEEELSLLFPTLSIARMDLDTTRTKMGFDTIINDFEIGKTNILVGTQMITKGFDFEGVGLVGVFDADRLLNFPDFRAHERAFQLMMQVGGRAGRRDVKGQVYIQTMQPEHPVFKHLIAQATTAFLEDTLRDRSEFSYPPYHRLINIICKSRVEDVGQQMAEKLQATLSPCIRPAVILGPGKPIVDRVKQEYITHLLLKIPRNGALIDVKKNVNTAIAALQQEKIYKSVRVYADVDPY